MTWGFPTFGLREVGETPAYSTDLAFPHVLAKVRQSLRISASPTFTGFVGILVVCGDERLHAALREVIDDWAVTDGDTRSELTRLGRRLVAERRAWANSPPPVDLYRDCSVEKWVARPYRAGDDGIPYAVRWSRAETFTHIAWQKARDLGIQAEISGCAP